MLLLVPIDAKIDWSPSFDYCLPRCRAQIVREARWPHGQTRGSPVFDHRVEVAFHRVRLSSVRIVWVVVGARDDGRVNALHIGAQCPEILSSAV